VMVWSYASTLDTYQRTFVALRTACSRMMQSDYAQPAVAQSNTGSAREAG
jgi:hypothetical protein